MQIIVILNSLVQDVLIICVIIHVCNDSIKVLIVDIVKDMTLKIIFLLWNLALVS